MYKFILVSLLTLSLLSGCGLFHKASISYDIDNNGEPDFSIVYTEDGASIKVE